MKQLTIGLIGNPNSGKTTLFNQLTGSHQRVGNWAGVTVERKEGYFFTENNHIKLVDLPGIYSLTTISEQTSLDEQITCNYILNGNTDLIINVVDASNLERNLYLTLQILEPNIPCIIALNMIDIANKQNIIIDINRLSKILNCPVIPLISTRASGINELKKAIDIPLKYTMKKLVEYPLILLLQINRLSKEMSDNLSIQQRRWLAFQLLEGNIYSLTNISHALKILPQIKKILINKLHEDPALIIANSRYKFITDICDTVSNTKTVIHHIVTEKLDCIILHRWMGIPIFLFVMYIMFFLAINVGGALQPFFDISSITIFIQGIQWLGYTLHFPEWLTIFLVQSGGGVNTILSMVPQISIMYLSLSFLEDSGYMARAAFVVDRVMQTLGLPGKSFVPLIVGFGCNVPAVMSARTLDAPRERLITVLMVPFISCGARLVIFAIFSTAFFGQGKALAVFSLYILGIIMAIVTGIILKYTIMRGEASPFIMELPAYHVPYIKNLLLQTWVRLKSFILRAGKVIVIANILIGTLNSFSFSGKPINFINDSALASISKVITPVLQPIGIHHDNWQATVGLITGAIAKEVVISTLNTLYTVEQINKIHFNPETYNLIKGLKEAVNQTWQNLYKIFHLTLFVNPIKNNPSEMSSISISIMSNKFISMSAAYAYLIFVLLYVPCISVMGAIARESNYNWMVFSILWSLNIAYSLATIFYQVTNFLYDPQYSAITITLVIIFNILLFIALRHSKKRFNIKLINDYINSNCSNYVNK
ncbi:Fe(2+) transporter FeoB [Candidatus Profftia lariciata]|uniref:Fe(2+) transporter permease subunit FeoB n=1 Tax=Candidatus Profftia lariciata TaxID=1987921 RepID=UPI001D028DFE|nr:Fe(2+) transporter permease subunit FeoB [Candidatus Profftia lariciata]UDG81560.1 Fe(2+) transporter FeoB [Candidatus Profftia lariciata]